MNQIPYIANMTKTTFQSEVPIQSGNEITFMGKIIAYIIPKDTSNLTQNLRSEVNLNTTINNKK